MDVITVLTESKNPNGYLSDLKDTLAEESGQPYENIVKLKLKALDGKMRLTDVTTTNNLITLLNNIKSNYKDEFIDWLNQTRLEQLYNSNSTINTLLYYGNEGAVSIEVIIDKENETMWATQKTIAQLFDVGIPAINKHLKNIFEVVNWKKNQLFPKWK